MRQTTSLHLLAAMTVVLLISSAAFVTTAEGSPTPAEEHKCVHDQLVLHHNVTPIGITLTYEDPETGAVVYEGVSRSSSGTYESIRIRVFFDDLDNASQYCTSASGTAPDFQGGKQSCSANTVLTAEKKDILKNKLIPEALTLHTDRLKVDPLTAAIIVPPGNLGNICNSFSIPASHKTTGVADSDLLVYVAVGTMSGTASAWATTCSFLLGPNGEKGRSLVGVINVSPAVISTARTSVRLVAHEMLHAMGFSGSYFEASGMSSTATVRQKTNVPVITSAKVVSAAKEHYGCNSLTHMELEDAGGSGTAGSHWKRRNAKYDLMSSIITADGYYTAMTIAAMEDLGYYQGDYSKAEKMPWGLNAGCKLLTDMCMTDSVSLNESMFCTGGDRMCTSDRHAVGPCLTAGDPGEEWAASYGVWGTEAVMDYCPYVTSFSNTRCEDGDLWSVPNSKFGDSSRCLDVNTESPVCAAITCSEHHYTVQFATGNAVRCLPGTTVDIPDTKRKATCPPYLEVCNKDCFVYCETSGAMATMATCCSGVLFALLAVLVSMLV